MPIAMATSLTIAINLISIAIDQVDMTLMLHMAAFLKLEIFIAFHVKRAQEQKRNETKITVKIDSMIYHL